MTKEYPRRALRSTGHGPIDGMWWDCDRHGCFNVRKRLKLKAFSSAFLRGWYPTDIDGIFELGGNFLVFEWKPPGANLPTGQRILLQQLSRQPNFTVLLIEGDAETMEVKRYRAFKDGTPSAWKACTLEGLCDDIRRHWTIKVCGRVEVAP